MTAQMSQREDMSTARTTRRLPAGPGTVDYWAAALDPASELDPDTRALVASRARQRWMAVVGRLGGQARTGRESAPAA